MNRKKNIFKKNKGITLVTVVVTVIILIILAGVSIKSILGEKGLIIQTQEASEKAIIEQEKEENSLYNIEEYIEGNTEKWIQEGTIVRRGSKTLKVGEFINYDQTNNGEINNLVDTDWRVLGAENGELLLMSTIDIGNLTLFGVEGLKNGIEELDNMCLLYGKGKKATGARSIRVEDINRITGYDPNNTGNGKKYGEGKEYEYEIEKTYGAGFKYYDELLKEWREVKQGENVTLKSTYYSYYPTTLTSSESDEKKGLMVESEEYKMLFMNSDNSAGANYWLASYFIRIFTEGGYINYGLRVVNEEEVQRSYLVSYITENAEQYGVRAVVSLSSDVNIIEDEKGELQIKD